MVLVVVAWLLIWNWKLDFRIRWYTRNKIKSCDFHFSLRKNYWSLYVLCHLRFIHPLNIYFGFDLSVPVFSILVLSFRFINNHFLSHYQLHFTECMNFRLQKVKYFYYHEMTSFSGTIWWIFSKKSEAWWQSDTL